MGTRGLASTVVLWQPGVIPTTLHEKAVAAVVLGSAHGNVSLLRGLDLLPFLLKYRNQNHAYQGPTGLGKCSWERECCKGALPLFLFWPLWSVWLPFEALSKLSVLSKSFWG